MKAIIFSDLQIDAYKIYSHITPEGINDRLIDHIDVLEEIKDYATEHNIDKILFLGDGFDSRGSVNVIAANLFMKWKHEVSSAGITQYDLVGNHDLTAKSHSHNSLELFSKLKDVHVIDKPKWIILGDTGIYFIPYMHRTDEIREALKNCVPPSKIDRNKSIALMHYGLFDTEINGRVITEYKGVESEGQVKLSDLDDILLYVKNVFLGHYHTHATYNGNVHYVGTPLQHNWGEASLPGRFMVVDFEDGTFEAVHTNAPRFIDFDNPNINKDLIKGNFCRANVKTLAEREGKVKFFLDNGARAADVMVSPEVEKKISNTNMNLSMSFMDMGNKLLDIDSLDKYDRSKLERILKSALEFASEKVS